MSREEAFQKTVLHSFLFMPNVLNKFSLQGIVYFPHNHLVNIKGEKTWKLELLHYQHNFSRFISEMSFHSAACNSSTQITSQRNTFNCLLLSTSPWPFNTQLFLQKFWLWCCLPASRIRLTKPLATNRISLLTWQDVIISTLWEGNCHRCNGPTTVLYSLVSEGQKRPQKCFGVC